MGRHNKREEWKLLVSAVLIVTAMVLVYVGVVYWGG